MTSHSDIRSHSTAADEVHSLLAVVADPAKHRTRLEELIAQEKATDEKIAALNEMADRTRRQNSAAEALTIVLNNRKTALDARETEIEERVRNLDLAAASQKKSTQAAEQKLKQREAAVAGREAAVQQRESDVKEMETETRTAFEQATALRDKVQRQAAAVQLAVTSLQ